MKRKNKSPVDLTIVHRLAFNVSRLSAEVLSLLQLKRLSEWIPKYGESKKYSSIARRKEADSEPRWAVESHRA
jgi:hypothetical protein